MANAYLFIFSDNMGTASAVKAVLNSIPEVSDWRHELPGCIYLISDASSQVIAEKIRAAIPKGAFLISELHSSNSYGWLHKDSWYLLNNKRRAPTT